MDIENILNTIQVTGTAQRVYLELLKSGSSSARKVAENIGLPKSTVYDGLRTLEERGLVLERTQDGKKVFGVNDPDAITQIIDNQKRKLDESSKAFESMSSDLRANIKTTEPMIRFFSGTEGLEKMLSDILWYENIETYTMWPMKNMIDVLDMKYLAWHNKRRNQRGITLRAIRSHEDTKVDLKKHPYLSTSAEFSRTLRFAPKWMKWDMSYWIYANKVTFISAGKESFGFTVQSDDFVTVMKAQWEAVWRISEEK